MTGKKVVA